MRKMIFFVLLAALSLIGSGGFTQASPELATGQDKPHEMNIEMTGGAEAPGPGDSDGSGAAKLVFNLDKGEVCFDITVKDIQTPTAAHIHTGASGKAGGVKVPFKKASDGSWKNCVNADKAVLTDIVKNPGNFYINVHNQEFPNGALRGQLGK